MSTLLRAVIDASGLSRRKAFAAIREGRVSSKGTALLEPSSPYTDAPLDLDGESLNVGPAAHVYLMLNKPPSTITTAADEQGRTTVLDLVPPELRATGLHAVGRLDRDTTGLLILTNDGDLTYSLTHPSHEVEKEYWMRLTTPFDEEQLDALRQGVYLEGELRRPVQLRRIIQPPFQLSMTIREGRNRQVRRMVQAAGGKVSALRRVREGNLTLSNLPEGAVRPLTEEELVLLRGEGH